MSSFNIRAQRFEIPPDFSGSRSKHRQAVQQHCKTIEDRDKDVILVTWTPERVKIRLQALEGTKAADLNDFHKASSSLQAIKENWKENIEKILLVNNTNVKPTGRPETWDQRLLGILAILSDVTPGQGIRIGEILVESFQWRANKGKGKGKVTRLDYQDVRRVIDDLLESVNRPIAGKSSSHRQPEPRRGKKEQKASANATLSQLSTPSIKIENMNTDAFFSTVLSTVKSESEKEGLQKTKQTRVQKLKSQPLHPPLKRKRVASADATSPSTSPISESTREKIDPPLPASVPPAHISLRPIDNRELNFTGDLYELRDEFVLLKKPNQDGYDTFGYPKLMKFLEENWNIKLVDWCQPKSLRPKMSHEVKEYIQEDLKKRGDSVEQFQKEIHKQDKSVLDWGISMIAHLSLLSEYTVDQGDIVLRMLNGVVNGRARRARKYKDPQMQITDVKKLIEDILDQHDIPMKKIGEIDVSDLYSTDGTDDTAGPDGTNSTDEMDETW